MASSFTKKRFREPESVEHTIENVKKSTPRSTMYKNPVADLASVKINYHSSF